MSNLHCSVCDPNNLQTKIKTKDMKNVWVVYYEQLLLKLNLEDKTQKQAQRACVIAYIQCPSAPQHCRDNGGFLLCLFCGMPSALT